MNGSQAVDTDIDRGSFFCLNALDITLEFNGSEDFSYGHWK